MIGYDEQFGGEWTWDGKTARPYLQAGTEHHSKDGAQKREHEGTRAGSYLRSIF